MFNRSNKGYDEYLDAGLSDELQLRTAINNLLTRCLTKKIGPIGTLS